MDSESVSVWSELLPEDLLVKIAGFITLYVDLLSFKRVCTSWRSAARNIAFVPKYPTLMLAEKEEDKGQVREFFHPFGGVFKKELLPEASQRRCLSSHGWLLTVGKNDVEVKLLHPFSRTQIDLPKLTTFPYYEKHKLFFRHDDFIERMVISSDPALSSDFLVIVTWANFRALAFCRYGDVSWTTIDRAFCDITYHNEKLYGLGYCGRITVYDINGPDPTSEAIVSQMPLEFFHLKLFQAYLLGWGDYKLLMVTRDGRKHDDHEEEEVDGTKNDDHEEEVDVASNEDREPVTNDDHEEEEVDVTNDDDWRTYLFEVFEYDLINKNWSKIKDLGNKALFLGENSSLAMKVNEGEGEGMIKANCIYFTDDCRETYFFNPNGGGYDMGVYCMSDKTIKPYFEKESRSIICPPLWILPSFC